MTGGTVGADVSEIRALGIIGLRADAESWQTTQASAAERLGAIQRALNALLRGRLDRFRQDALARLAERAGLAVRLPEMPQTRAPPTAGRARNQPRIWIADMSDYDTDILVWSERQGALLRRRTAGELINEADLDWVNIAEEIESVGREQLHAVESLLLQALIHMLKAEAWPLSREVPHWQAEA